MKLELNKVYKDREGTQWKVICVTSTEKHGIKNFLGVNKEQISYRYYDVDGTYYDCKSALDLIEFIGDDFRAEPFKVTFDASILSYSNKILDTETITVSLHRKAWHNFIITEKLHENQSRLYNCKITIEEIIK